MRRPFFSKEEWEKEKVVTTCSSRLQLLVGAQMRTECLDLISSSPTKLRSSPLKEVNLDHLKQRVSLLLYTIKHLDTKFKRNERMKIGKVNLTHLKERVSLLLNTLKHLDTKFWDDEIMKIGKKKIRVMASKLEYSLKAARMADLSPTKIHNVLQSIAREIDSMNQYQRNLLLSKQSQCSLQLKELVPWSLMLPSSSNSLPSSDNIQFLSVGVEDFVSGIRLELTGSSCKLEMMGIVGIAGIGKTTLAQTIFEDPSVIEHFDLQAWITISQSHSKRDRLLQVLKCINQQRYDDILGQTEASLKEELYWNLKDQRYLIVVDNLWSVQAWNEMRMSYRDDSMGSRILFTSRESNVIEDLNCKNIFQMSPLAEQTSWDLLQKKVFGQDACPPDLIDIGKQIAKKCQGLPLAIVVMAGILLKISKKTESWKVIAESISSLVFNGTNPCQEMIALSYKHLPAHLKSCFLYMCAFPGGGFEIESQMLTRFWIAEGFVISSNLENLEQVADQYLKELIDRNLVLTPLKRSNGNIKTCLMHDMLLEFCIKQARQESFLDVINNFNEEEDSERVVPQKNLSKEKNHRSCRYSFQCTTFEDIPLQSQAHTAIFKVSSHDVPDILLHDLDAKWVVVLDMIALRFVSFPEEQVSRLLRLKYLALTTSFKLPASVFKLLKLQTLIVNYSKMSSYTTAALTLPLEFWESVNLRHVQLQVANYLPPPDDESSVEKMVSLKTLSKVSLSSFSNKESFARIPNVTKLGVCETMEDFDANYLWNRFFENLVLLSHLHILKVYCLEMDYLSRRVLPIPSPKAFPKSLRKLTLSRSRLPWEKMKILSELPNLEVLKLKKYAFQGLEWNTQVAGFQRLSYLLIEETDLEHWRSVYSFPRLQKLVLKFCHFLEEIPEPIGDIPTLLIMELCDCSSMAEQSVKYIQELQEEYGHGIEVIIRRKIIRN